MEGEWDGGGERRGREGEGEGEGRGGGRRGREEGEGEGEGKRGREKGRKRGREKGKGRGGRSIRDKCLTSIDVHISSGDVSIMLAHLSSNLMAPYLVANFAL